MLLVSTLVNAFYPCIIGIIVVAIALELALKLSGGSSALSIAAGGTELCIVPVALYGVVGAVLHGVHDRQVLKGFDDALVESALWKRKPLTQAYCDGKWANPMPLLAACIALGLVGMAASALDIIVPMAAAYWLGVYVPILFLVSCFHACRHEAYSSEVSGTLEANGKQK